MSDRTSQKQSTDPFSEQELNKFHRRAPGQLQAFIDSLRQSKEEYEREDREDPLPKPKKG